MRKFLVVTLLASLVGLSCDQRTNPLNPQADVQITDVREVNTTINIELQALDSAGNNVVCVVTLDPERLEITFREQYGGRNAYITDFQVRYFEWNGQNLLPYTPLWGQTSIFVPAGSTATMNLNVFQWDVLRDLIQNPRPITAEIWIAGHDEAQNPFQFQFYHNIAVVVYGCTPAAGP